jgi:SAM-dependent methyltransferase
MSAADYLLDTASAEDAARLAAVQAELDPGTIALLERLGVTPGLRCLEVGAGAGSLAAWLSDRVGPTGAVVATDLAPVHLHAHAGERKNLEPLRHDIRTDPLPAGGFDLVHVRWVLHHLAEPRQAIASMVASLKPGGRLLAEEVDVSSLRAAPSTPPERAALVQRCVDAMRALLARGGGSFDYGRQLFADVRASGLTDLGAEGRCMMGFPGAPLSTNWLSIVRRIRGPLVASGVLRETDVDELLAMARDPGVTMMGYTTMAVWGTKANRLGRLDV